VQACLVKNLRNKLRTININIYAAQACDQQPGVKCLTTHVEQSFGTFAVLPLTRQWQLRATANTDESVTVGDGSLTECMDRLKRNRRLSE
jgi:hypothetical protein